MDCDAVYIGQTPSEHRLRRDEHQSNFYRSHRYHSVLLKHRITHGHAFNLMMLRSFTMRGIKKERVYGDVIYKERR